MSAFNDQFNPMGGGAGGESQYNFDHVQSTGPPQSSYMRATGNMGGGLGGLGGVGGGGGRGLGTSAGLGGGPPGSGAGLSGGMAGGGGFDARPVTSNRGAGYGKQAPPPGSAGQEGGSLFDPMGQMGGKSEAEKAGRKFLCRWRVCAMYAGLAKVSSGVQSF